MAWACWSSTAKPLRWPLYLLVLLSSCWQLPGLRAAAGSVHDVISVRGLQALMYREQKGTGGVYRLLNATGTIGSGVPPGDVDYVQAPLQHWARYTSNLMTEPACLLVQVADSADFFQQWRARGDLQQQVAGVLIDDSELPSRLSSLGPFPLAEYSPYPAGAWQWNPGGLPLSSSSFPAPVMLLQPGMAADAQQRANQNALQNRKGRQYYGRIGLTMLAKHNSSHCLGQFNCKPLGGFSVWAAMPPLTPGVSSDKPVTLVVAQVDGVDAFHDEIVGANSPVSGLIGLLLIAQILQQQLAAAAANAAAPSALLQQRQLVFLALAGEPWGYMGSRRLLWELSQGTPSVEGLQLERIDQVLELGQIGRCAAGGGTCNLFVHQQPPPGFGDAGALVGALRAAAADVPGTPVTVSAASSSNPGIPPSSLMSFLRVNASIAGVVVAEFDSSVQDPFYGSRFDDGARVNATSLAGAAAVVAAALHRLAGGSPADFKVNMTQVEARAGSLVGCLLLRDPGLSCRLAGSLMVPGYQVLPNGSRNYAARHYVGVLQTLPPDLQTPQLKDDVYRFLWNLLAVHTSVGPQGGACDPFVNKCLAGQVCAGWKQGSKDPALMGRCVNATVRYVPSYSTRIGCANCDDWLGAFTWVPSAAAAAWNARYAWPEDPMWTESDWPLGMPYVQLFLREPAANDVAVLIAGLVVTGAAVLLCGLAKATFEGHLKVH